MPIKQDQLVVACILLFAACSSISLAWLISVNSAQIETQLLDVLAHDEMEELSTLVYRNAEAPLPRTDMVEVWLEDHWDSGILPEPFRNLQKGQSLLIQHEGHRYHVLRGDILDHDAVIAIDLRDFQARRRVLNTLLIVIALLAPISTALMGIYYLSKRLTPVIDMARRVANLDPKERGVRLANEFKDGEMQVVAAAFDTYQERMDRFVEREQAFCLAANHELRTPLATLSAGTEVIRAEGDSLTDRMRQTLERMHRSAQHMSSLLSGLMWLVRENEVPPSEYVELGDLVEKIIEQNAPLLTSRGVSYRIHRENEVHESLPVGHINIVLSNIIRNAIQHSPRGAVVELRVFDKSVAVKDSGSGIEANELSRIMASEFGEQGKHRGLGLYLSRKICEFHQWQLAIQSDLHTGTIVTIQMP